MGELSPWHWLIVIGVAVVLFGASRLPDAARSLGRSARILRSELRGDEPADSRDGARAAGPPETPGPAATSPTAATSASASASGTDPAADGAQVTPVPRDEPVTGRADPQH